MLISESIDRFCGDKSLFGLADSSVEQYRLQLNVFGRWLASKQVYDTGSITEEHARAYLIFKRPDSKQWTLCGRRSILKLWFDWMDNTGIAHIDASAMPKVNPPKQDEIRRVIVEEPGASRLIAYTRAQYRLARQQGKKIDQALKDVVLVTLLFGMGLRISEVASMRVKHINVHRRELSIPRSKGNVPRYTAIPPSVMGVLRFYLNAIKASAGSLLFTHCGKGYAPNSLARRVQELGERAGVMLTSHTGRRYCISKLANVNLLVAKEQAGHKRIETTLLYVVPSRDEMRRTMRNHDPLRPSM